MVVAKELVSVDKTGGFVAGSALATLVRKAGNLSVDPMYRAPALKFYE